MPATWRSVFHVLLSRAAWGRLGVHYAKRTVWLRAGQLYSGLRQVAEAAGVGLQACRNAVSVFTRLGWLRAGSSAGNTLRRGQRTMWTLVDYDAWRDRDSTRKHTEAVAPISTRKQENAAQPAGVPVDATYPDVNMAAVRESAPGFLREVLA